MRRGCVWHKVHQGKALPDFVFILQVPLGMEKRWLEWGRDGRKRTRANGGAWGCTVAPRIIHASLRSSQRRLVMGWLQEGCWEGEKSQANWVWGRLVLSFEDLERPERDKFKVPSKTSNIHSSSNKQEVHWSDVIFQNCYQDLMMLSVSLCCSISVNPETALFTG